MTSASLTVAIVGAGPSGFYAAEALLRAEHGVRVDVYDKLPVPFGLVRYGVAPDHPKLKSVTKVFEKIAGMYGFNFVGNVEVGRSVAIEELAKYYHAIIFASGAEREKDLGIPGEDLDGSHSAREFVAWYNGHPDYRDREFDFSHSQALIVGQGNVALDVARILAKTTDELASTDIAQHALEQLAESRIEDIHVVGRRGPAQAKFTNKELAEFADFANCMPRGARGSLELNEASVVELEDAASANARANLATFQKFAEMQRSESSRQCHFHFLRFPSRFVGPDRLREVELADAELVGAPFEQKVAATGSVEMVPCGLAIRCIGYRVDNMPGLPFDAERGILSNEGGRLVRDGEVVPGLYATGWAKRGSVGTIGTNRGDAVATVEALLADAEQLTPPIRQPERLVKLLHDAGTQIVGFEDWQRIDRVEVDQGTRLGKPRQKFARVEELLAAARGQFVTAFE